MKSNVKSKFFMTITLIIIIFNVIILVPKLTKYKGKIMNDLGEYNGYEYAYGTGTTYGLFRKSININDYEKISNYAPLSDKFFFHNNNEVIFTTRGYDIIRLNTATLDEKLYEYNNMSLVVIGINSKFIITEDADENAYIKILDIDTMEIVNSIEMNPEDFQITEQYIEFKDYKSKKSYRYNFSNEKLVNIDK